MLKRRELGRVGVMLVFGFVLGGRAAGQPKKIAHAQRPINTAYHLQIEFAAGSTHIEPKYEQDIGNVAHILDVYPYATCEIKGYTDNVGADTVNLRISEARARS